MPAFPLLVGRFVLTGGCVAVLQESENNGGGKAPHQDWRNYDDINEYFW
jgi:hypothetical protein